jgi:hypothetical protein
MTGDITRTLIDQLADALFRLEEHLEVEAAFPTFDLDKNLSLLADLRAQKARLMAATNEVERLVIDQMPAKTYTSGALSAERFANHKDVWDVRRTAWAVTEPACVNQDTGEVLVDEKAAWTIIDRLLQAANVDYFRVKSLAAFGLKADDFRDRELLRRTVKITRADTVNEVAS